MQYTSQDQTVLLADIREGKKYLITVTGATSAVSLEFQHVKSGAWFVHPGFTATPSAGGVIMSEVTAPVARMRVSLASPQVTDWTVTWAPITQSEY